MSDLTKEVLTIRKQIEKCSENDGSLALDVLKRLDKMAITKEILDSTRVGRSVNELRKRSTVDTVQKQAKAMVKKWKAVMDAATAAPAKTTAAAQAPAKSAAPAPAAAPSPSSTTAPVASKQPKAGSGATVAAAVSSSGTAPKMTGQTNRDNIRKKTFALLGDVSGNAAELAASIESEFFKECGQNSADAQYAKKVRSLFLNLRQNPELRSSLLEHVISPEQLAKMSPEEMAPASVHDQMEELKKQAIFKTLAKRPQDAITTTQFRCGRCNKNRCTYFQMQTRSADEPMTTFVTCLECNNSWKFC